jgi:catechol 2,3-dioxygenase-like lactoylglutathione lyase family enzyme
MIRRQLTAVACLQSIMFSHIFISVTDFERALRFHSAVMAALGLELRWCDPARPWAGWHSAGGGRPYFVICHTYNGQPHDPGNGQMVAFAAADRQTVHAAHAAALAGGGTCEGPPGPRPEYHEHYYGAYFRDPDGNKFCVACHAPLAVSEPRDAFDAALSRVPDVPAEPHDKR